MAIELVEGKPGNGMASIGGVGRPALHATSAARKRAYREKVTRLDVAIKPEIAETIADISEQLDCSRNELLNSLIRFALTNRNWKQVGLYGSKGMQ